MQVQKIPTPKLSHAKRDASEILSERENRLRLIQGLLILMLFVPMYMILHAVYEGILAILVSPDDAWMTALASSVYCIVLLLILTWITLPTLMGFLYMACEMARGEQSSLATMFRPFSAWKHYKEALLLAIFHMSGGCWLVLLLTWLHGFLRPFLDARWMPMLTAAAILLGLILMLRGFAGTAKVYFWRSYALGVRMRLRRMRAMRYGIVFFTRFLPDLLLGILSFGIFLLWDVLPRMAVAYFVYVRQIEDFEFGTEDKLPPNDKSTV